jgi:hypothetical protein
MLMTRIGVQDFYSLNRIKVDEYFTSFFPTCNLWYGLGNSRPQYNSLSI